MKGISESTVLMFWLIKYSHFQHYPLVLLSTQWPESPLTCCFEGGSTLAGHKKVKLSIFRHSSCMLLPAWVTWVWGLMPLHIRVITWQNRGWIRIGLLSLPRSPTTLHIRCRDGPWPPKQLLLSQLLEPGSMIGQSFMSSRVGHHWKLALRSAVTYGGRGATSISGS